LFDDANKGVSAVTSDDTPAGDAPLLSVFGGKITTYRKPAEHAWSRRCKWGDRACRRRSPRLHARAQSTRLSALLDGTTALADLGEPLGDGLYAADADYLVRRDWARTAEDILFRRSKLGLQVDDATTGASAPGSAAMPPARARRRLHKASRPRLDRE
jgi:glycerol-3-phosphate dehydrogenase